MLCWICPQIAEHQLKVSSELRILWRHQYCLTNDFFKVKTMIGSGAIATCNSVPWLLSAHHSSRRRRRRFIWAHVPEAKHFLKLVQPRPPISIHLRLFSAGRLELEWAQIFWARAELKLMMLKYIKPTKIVANWPGISLLSPWLRLSQAYA